MKTHEKYQIKDFYGNGWNWRLIGGMEPTEENRNLSRQLLVSSWGARQRIRTGDDKEFPAGRTSEEMVEGYLVGYQFWQGVGGQPL